MGKRCKGKATLILILFGIFFPVFLVSCGGGGSGSSGTPPPVAGFSASPATGFAPYNVTFTDSSTGSITSRSWNFGDGGTSTAQNPTHNYVTGGNHTVSLTVTGPGGSNTITKAAHINVKPSAGFLYSSDPNNPDNVAPLSVTFTDSSTGGNNTSWLWDFGDESDLSTVRNPVHTYFDNGVYTVWLTVTGPGGDNTTMKEKIIIVGSTPSQPVAGFSASPTTGPAPLTVAFTDNSTGVISAWAWNFGDGGTSTEQNPSHEYLTGGNYTVALTASGPGGSNSTTKTGYIKVTPLAAFTASPTFSNNAPLLVTFTDNSTGGTITSWAWDFGDGGTSALQNPSHNYLAAGNYTVSLTATGPGGSNTNTKTSYINIGSFLPPVAGFSATPTTGSIPLNVAFTDQSTGVLSTWSWNFGDGGTSALQNPSHIYAAAGTYTVSLTATGPGGSNTDTKTAYITTTRPVFTDNFNRANANPIGGNWTTAPGCSDMQIVTNAAYATVDRFINCSYWNANTFTDDQYSQVTIAGVHNSKGPAVRIQTGGVQQNYYYAKIDNTTQISIKKNVNGSYGLLPPSFTVPTLQATDTIKLSVTGTTLELFVNGVSQGTRTDSTFTSGVPGIWNFFLLHPLDDWEGGSL